MNYKLNALVAEHVMGYTKYKPRCMHAAEGRTFFQVHPYSVTTHTWEDDVGPVERRFDPAQDIAQAMEVLERRLRGARVHIEKRYGPYWVAAIIPLQPKDVHAKSYVGESEILAEAICRASLRAVGVSEEEIEKALK